MFHKFEPLAVKDPALTASLEQMVQRAGQTIPPERMFWMGAGEKTTGLNAYVTGLGASKRIVVWDTTIAKMTTPQIVFVAGHEMGHYVLEHIWKGLAFAFVILFVLFYLGYCSGPVGYSRVFYSLYQITGDKAHLEWVERYARGISESGAPAHQTPGLWNVVCQCCGTAGISDLFTSLFIVTRKPECVALSGAD